MRLLQSSNPCFRRCSIRARTVKEPNFLPVLSLSSLVLVVGPDSGISLACVGPDTMDRPCFASQNHAIVRLSYYACCIACRVALVSPTGQLDNEQLAYDPTAAVTSWMVTASGFFPAQFGCRGRGKASMLVCNTLMKRRLSRGNVLTVGDKAVVQSLRWNH